MNNYKLQVLTIGSEILEGSILDTNSKYLCTHLNELGYTVDRLLSLPDHKKTLKDNLLLAIKDYDVTLCSGGLGPTSDDITLSTASEVFNSKFYLNTSLLKELKKRYENKLSDLENLALVPREAELLLNAYGTAPGFVFKRAKKALILLPGVPHELQHLMRKKVCPYLKKHFPTKKTSYQKILHLCRVTESEISPHLLQLKRKYPYLDFGIYPNLGILSIHFKCHATSNLEASSLLKEPLKIIKSLYGKRSFDGKYSSIEEAIHHLFIRKKLSLSLSESCSGGALAQHFTKQANASKYLKGSLVSYSNDVKRNLLGVSPTVLKNEGAVNRKCVEQMTKGAFSLFKSDVVIVISGIAGPSGGTKEKPIGTIWASIAVKNKIISIWNLNLPKAERETIIKRAIHYILAELWIKRDNL